MPVTNPAARAVGVPSSLKSRRRFCSPGKKPGVMKFTRTPRGAHSRARNCVRLRTVALAALYATTRERQVRRHAGDVDDAALAALRHRGAELLAGQQRATDEVEVEVGPPVVGRDGLEGPLGRDGDLRVVATGGEKLGAPSTICRRDAPDARLATFGVATEHGQVKEGFHAERTTQRIAARSKAEYAVCSGLSIMAWPGLAGTLPRVGGQGVRRPPHGDP